MLVFKSRMFRASILSAAIFSLLVGMQFSAPSVAAGDEIITVSGHVYLSRIGYWVVAGKTTVKGPRKFMSIYVGPDATGELLGVVRVDRNGNWIFSSEFHSPVKPDATSTISMVSSSGGELLAFPIRIR